MGRATLRSADVLATFHADLDRHRRTVEGWRALDERWIAARPGPRRWSAIDCLEHVRRANAAYLRGLAPTLARAEARRRGPVETFRPGAVGDWMQRTLAPRTARPAPDGRAAIRLRMPTAGAFDPTKDATPPGPAATIERFLLQNDEMKRVAERLERVDLRLRTNTLIGPFLRLRLGDVARYLVAHTDRHFVQAERAIDAARG